MFIMKLLILFVLILIGESYCAAIEKDDIRSYEDTSLVPERENVNNIRYVQVSQSL